MSRGAAWLRRRLLEPEPPLVAVEVRERALGVVRLSREGSRLSVAAAASLELPAGALKISITQPNLAEPEAFRQTLRAALERAGALPGGRVALVLPDPVARVAIVPVSEGLGRGGVDTEERLRFHLRKAVPFDIRQARVAWVRGGTGEGTLLVTAIFEPVLEGYEQATQELGLDPGLVELAGLAILNAVEGRRPPADRLILNWDDGYVSLVLTREGWPALVRTLVGSAASAPDNVVREAAQTVLYYQERLGGTGLAEAVVRSAALPAEDAGALLREPLGMTPEVLDPWIALGGGDRGAASQALAGAAASVAGRAA